MIESRTWLLIALFVVLLVALLNLSTIEENAPPPLLGREVQEIYDYGMTGVTRVQFDDNGRIASKLSAKTLFHYPLQQKIKLTAPQLLFNMAGASWQLSSKTGLLSENTHELSLQEKVRLYKLTPQTKSSLNNPAVSMKMSELVFNLKQQIGYSPYPVELIAAPWKITGVGLAIDVKKQQLTILDKVFATDEINQSN